ncbi:MAG: hypothetical protein AAGJ87_17380, partial [Pseudomonadota bacterium]
EIAAGAQPGEAVNAAFAVNVIGAPVSNTAEAAIQIREDLLRSRLTIFGRIVEDACNPEEDWPRKISGGTGVAGVRLYMETGAYVVSDEDGLFHFEDVEARTHVVQVDETTLPDGYELVACEENTRYAGSVSSQFVDAQGGAAWRANFYVRNTNPNAVAKESADATTNSDTTEYLNFDKAWLDKQALGFDWAYPSVDTTPSTRSVNLGVKHDIAHRVHLFLNGEKVQGVNFAGRDINAARTIALSRWRGVALRDGRNEFEAVTFNQKGDEVARIQKEIFFITEVERAEFLPDASRLVADGRTPAAIAVRLTDAFGRPVHTGRIVSVEIDPPYRARDLQRLEDTFPLDAPLAAQSGRRRPRRPSQRI